MHKDIECGVLLIDEVSGRIVNYKDMDPAYTPFLGNSTVENIKRWWEMRAIPAERETIRNLINSLTIVSPEQYLAKNLGLSITDTYWIRPVELDLRYDDVNFFNLSSYTDGRVPYHNNTSYDPNASLSGQMEKYWDLTNGIPKLVKMSYRNYGQQSINEVIATRLHELQNSSIPFVKYICKKTDDGGIACICDAFTSKNIEFVCAYEVVSSEKKAGDTSYYNSFINICVKRGIDRELIQDYMDYQTLTDFVISNTDEHLMNFGIIRDSNTMRLLGPAPIFDSGNSMFYSDVIDRPFTRIELLSRHITSFYNSEEKLLKKVKNKKVVRHDLLPSPKEIKEIFSKYNLPEQRTNIIIANYEVKCQMLKELQEGKSISLFQEKKK